MLNARGSYTARVTRTQRRVSTTSAPLQVYGLVPCMSYQATELIALDLFNSGARQITIGDVECHVRPSTRPSRTVPERGRCEAAAMVRPDRVLMVVRAWQRQAYATKVRATALIHAIADPGSTISIDRRSGRSTTSATIPSTPGKGRS